MSQTCANTHSPTPWISCFRACHTLVANKDDRLYLNKSNSRFPMSELQKRAAFVLRGGVARQTGRFLDPHSIYNEAAYVKYHAACVASRQHIIDANPSWEFDVFIHSWNVDLEESLRDLYKPVSATFEDNHHYKQDIQDKVANLTSDEFGGVSWLLSLKKSIELVERHNVLYDKIILYRPDVLLWKDMDLPSYQNDRLYVNAHPNGEGDFHFVMSSANMSRFKWCYDWISKENPYAIHASVKRFVRERMGIEITPDAILPGRDQEVIRKLSAIRGDFFDKRKLRKYGLEDQDIFS